MRILIAEDNDCFRQLLCIPLHAHDVIVAGDGAEAVTKAVVYLPDIILMDVQMPEVDGFTALELLKADEDTADIPVVLMSAAYVRPHDVARGLNLGAVDYWKKPFDFDANELPTKLEGYAAKKKVRESPRT